MATRDFEDIVDDFEFLEEWEDRYRYIIEQAKLMSPLEEALKVPATKVDGCASQVWLHPKISDDIFPLKGTVMRSSFADLLPFYANSLTGSAFTTC